MQAYHPIKTLPLAAGGYTGPHNILSRTLQLPNIGPSFSDAFPDRPDCLFD